MPYYVCVTSRGTVYAYTRTPGFEIDRSFYGKQRDRTGLCELNIWTGRVRFFPEVYMTGRKYFFIKFLTEQDRIHQFTSRYLTGYPFRDSARYSAKLASISRLLLLKSILLLIAWAFSVRNWKSTCSCFYAKVYKIHNIFLCSDISLIWITSVKVLKIRHYFLLCFQLLIISWFFPRIWVAWPSDKVLACKRYHTTKRMINNKHSIGLTP